jgi:hypothetical protein
MRGVLGAEHGLGDIKCGWRRLVGRLLGEGGGGGGGGGVGVEAAAAAAGWGAVSRTRMEKGWWIGRGGRLR